ncbi:hypothetical protein OWR28_10170 [Chryseobacterium sp. 1B4]
MYSSPVVEKSMAERYELGAYSGIGLDNLHKRIRFSTAPSDFQSMVFDANTGKYEFIEPINKEKMYTESFSNPINLMKILSNAELLSLRKQKKR